jgi:hypothetical protein
MEIKGPFQINVTGNHGEGASAKEATEPTAFSSALAGVTNRPGSTPDQAPATAPFQFAGFAGATSLRQLSPGALVKLMASLPDDHDDGYLGLVDGLLTIQADLREEDPAAVEARQRFCSSRFITVADARVAAWNELLQRSSLGLSNVRNQE